MGTEEKYMQRCIEIAKGGLWEAPPNPLVGAVIVADGRIIGEGYHVRHGEAHAEVNAINSVSMADRHLLKQSTIYVSLEPCAHYGKTPPCADLIIREQIPRVVVGCRDSFAQVDGKGIQKLREAGCKVTVGILEKECQRLNKKFFTVQEKHRPYVTLKWAQSADGLIDRKRDSGNPVIFSTPRTQMLTHKLRSEHAAIMVGKNTALLDNPSLNVRNWAGHSPVRVVLDRTASLPPTLHLFDGSFKTLVFTEKAMTHKPQVEYIQTDFSRPVLPQVLDQLLRRNLQSLLVEGGSQLLQSFIDENLWDEIRVEHSPLVLQEGIPAPAVNLKKPYTEMVFDHRKYHIMYNFI